MKFTVHPETILEIQSVARECPLNCHRHPGVAATASIVVVGQML